MAFEDFVCDEEVVKIAQPHVIDLIGVHEIFGQRLKDQSPKQNEPGRRIIPVGLDQVGPIPRQLHFDRLLRFIPQDIKFDFVAFEFSLDDFGHLDPLAVELDKTVTGDWEIVDSEQHVALLQNSEAGCPQRIQNSP